MADADYIRVIVTSNDRPDDTPVAFDNILVRPISFGVDKRVQVALESITYQIKPIAAQQPDVDAVHERTVFINTDAIRSTQLVGSAYSNAIARITVEPQKLIGFNVRQPAGQPNGEQTFYQPIYRYEYTYEAPSLKFVDAVGGEISSIATTITSVEATAASDPAADLLDGVTTITYVFRAIE